MMSNLNEPVASVGRIVRLTLKLEHEPNQSRAAIIVGVGETDGRPGLVDLFVFETRHDPGEFLADVPRFVEVQDYGAPSWDWPPRS